MVNEQAVGDAARHYAQVISALHRFDLPESEHWKPHESQLLIGNAVFKRGCKFIFVQCGRKFGKTEIIVYCLWRWALMNPGSSCYYICPELKQAKEIIWKARDQRGRLRIQEFGPQEYIESIDNTELRITFKNGSFIKCDGSDNWAAWKGISPNFIVLDEFAEFKPEFYGAMNPNRATFDAPMVIIGTPPEKIWLDRDKPHQYVELAQECRQQMLEDPNDAFWIKRPSWCNPLPNIQNFLRKEKKVLFRMGKEDEWWRDYGAELVPAKARKIFPNFVADSTMEGSHVIAHDLMIVQMSEYCGAR